MLGSRLILINANPEIVHVSEIASPRPTPFARSLSEELRRHLLVLRNSETPHVRYAQVHFGSCKPLGGGKLIPMHCAHKIYGNAESNLVKIANLIFCRRIAGACRL